MEERIHLHHGDCLQYLESITEPCLDLTCTSPPYNCRKPYGEYPDEMSWSVYYIWMEQILRAIYAATVPGGVVAINVPLVIRWQADHAFAHTWSDFDPEYRTHRRGEQVIGRGRIEPVGFRLFEIMRSIDPHMREPIIWVKGSREGEAICSDYRMGCDSDPYMRPCHEVILLGSKEQWYHRGGTGRRGGDAVPFLEETKDTWTIPPVTTGKHPAPFPIEIPDRLIQLFTHADDAVICDPFMGSGTTGLAAVRRGRSFIGCDIERKWFIRAQVAIQGYLDQQKMEL